MVFPVVRESIIVDLLRMMGQVEAPGIHSVRVVSPYLAAQVGPVDLALARMVAMEVVIRLLMGAAGADMALMVWLEVVPVIIAVRPLAAHRSFLLPVALAAVQEI